MHMVMALDTLVDMPVDGLILAVDMCMGMDMSMLMAMDNVTVAMLVAVYVGMLVGVLQTDGIPHHKHRGDYHYPKAQIKLQCGPLAKEQHAKHHAQEGRYGIIRAGLCCAKLLLRLDVKIDA